MESRRLSIATLLIRRISRQRARGSGCCSTQSRSTAIFPDTQTWPSRLPGYLGINYRTTSSFHTLPGTSPISGGAGTSVSQVGCAITFTFHSAGIVAPRGFAYRNVMITMLLGGLWHGAAWTFVIWGALHGTALLIHREWIRLTGGSEVGRAGDALACVADYDLRGMRCLDLFPRA